MLLSELLLPLPELLWPLLLRLNRTPPLLLLLSRLLRCLLLLTCLLLQLPHLLL